MNLDELRAAEGQEAICAAIAELDAALEKAAGNPKVGFQNSDERGFLNSLLEVKARLLLRLGEMEKASPLAERLRSAWDRDLQKVVTDPGYLEWRWITSSGTKLPPDAAGLNELAWECLESCRSARSAEIPFLLRALGGNDAGLACKALDFLFDHIEHQGSTYEVTPRVVRALVSLLSAGSISLPGFANRVRRDLNMSGIFRHVPKADRDWVSIKKSPIDGVVMYGVHAFGTYRNGVPHGPCVLLNRDNEEERGSYVDGKRSGPWEAFYSSGTRRAEGSYVDGERSGPWKLFHSSGTKKAEGSFVAGKQNGPWIEWLENGSVRSEGSWKLGKKTGEWRDGSADGRQVSVGTYKNDRRHGSWQDTRDGGTPKKSEWKDGVQVK